MFPALASALFLTMVCVGKHCLLWWVAYILRYNRVSGCMPSCLKLEVHATCTSSSSCCATQVGRVEVDVPGCSAAVEGAAMQAAFEQTDRVFWEWRSYDPVNASMYTPLSHIKRRVRRRFTSPG